MSDLSCPCRAVFFTRVAADSPHATRAATYQTCLHMMTAQRESSLTTGLSATAGCDSNKLSKFSGDFYNELLAPCLALTQTVRTLIPCYSVHNTDIKTTP